MVNVCFTTIEKWKKEKKKQLAGPEAEENGVRV